jgi:hypothetical protein
MRGRPKISWVDRFFKRCGATDPLTRKDVVELFGELDDIAVADIIATGATWQELAEAHTWLANDEALINAGKHLPSGRVGRPVERQLAWPVSPVTGQVSCRYTRGSGRNNLRQQRHLRRSPRAMGPPSRETHHPPTRTGALFMSQSAARRDRWARCHDMRAADGLDRA